MKRNLTVLLLVLVGSAAVEILSLLRSLAQQASISDALLTPMLKVLGIEVVTNLAAHICKDAGEGGIASTVELAGAICALYASRLSKPSATSSGPRRDGTLSERSAPP